MKRKLLAFAAALTLALSALPVSVALTIPSVKVNVPNFDNLVMTVTKLDGEYLEVFYTDGNFEGRLNVFFTYDDSDVSFNDANVFIDNTFDSVSGDYFSFSASPKDETTSYKTFIYPALRKQEIINIAYQAGLEAADGTLTSALHPIAKIAVQGTLAAVPANPSAQNIVIDGLDIKQRLCYNIDGNNYIKLRDVAALFTGGAASFDLEVDSTKPNNITLTLGKEYKLSGGECLDVNEVKPAVQSAWTLEVNGEAVDIRAYNIGGNNYFKLAELAEPLGIGVSYDGKTNSVVIDTKPKV